MQGGRQAPHESMHAPRLCSSAGVSLQNKASLYTSCISSWCESSHDCLPCLQMSCAAAHCCRAPMHCGVHPPAAVDVPACLKEGHCCSASPSAWRWGSRPASLQVRRHDRQRLRVLWPSGGAPSLQPAPGGGGAEAAPSRVGCCRHLVRSCAVDSRLLQSTAEAAAVCY